MDLGAIRGDEESWRENERMREYESLIESESEKKREEKEVFV